MMGDPNRYSTNDYQQALMQQQQQQQELEPRRDSQAEAKKKSKKRSSSTTAARSNAATAAAASAGHAGGGDSEAAQQAMVFPVKLHRMLTVIDDKANPQEDRNGAVASLSADDEEEASIVSWQPHGRCFLVHDKEAFVQRFLPSYFRQSKWASFQRQLNIYGFQRLTAGRDRGAYYHDMFIRGHPELATRIHRMKLKGIGQGRHRTNADLEPNFYRMKPVGSGDPSMDHISSVGSSNVGMMGSMGMTNVLAARQQQQQQQHLGATAGFSSGAPPSGANSLNVHQLFGTNGQPPPSSNNFAGNSANVDLSNLFFLTNGGDLSQASHVNAILAPQHQQEMFQAAADAPQGNANGSAFLLANLFNANSGGAVNHGNGSNELTPGNLQQQQLLQAHQESMDAAHNSSVSNLAPLLQGADPNFLTTATMMQYMADNNSESSQSQPNGTAAAAQNPWLQQQVAGQLEASTSGASAYRLPGMPSSNSNTDLAELANSLGIDGPSLSRMSAATVSSLLYSQFSSGRSENETAAAARLSNNTAHSPNLASLASSNPNMLLFAGLQDRHHRDSANNLMHLLDSTSPADPPATGNMTSTSGGRSIYHQAQNPPPSAQQYSFLNGAGAAAPTAIAELLGGSRMAPPPTNPTFLDSVYEPIPIKDDGSAAGNSQKLADGSTPGSPPGTGTNKGNPTFSFLDHQR